MEVTIVPNKAIVNISYTNRNINMDSNKKDVNINSQNKEIKAEASFSQQLMANDYALLKNKPKIENIELNGNKTFEDLGAFSLTNIEIEKLLNL